MDGSFAQWDLRVPSCPAAEVLALRELELAADVDEMYHNENIVDTTTTCNMFCIDDRRRRLTDVATITVEIYTVAPADSLAAVVATPALIDPTRSSYDAVITSLGASPAAVVVAVAPTAMLVPSAAALPAPPSPPPCSATCSLYADGASASTTELCVKYETDHKTVCKPRFTPKCPSGFSMCSQVAVTPTIAETCSGLKDKSGKWRKKKCVKVASKKPKKCTKKKQSKKCKKTCCEAGYPNYYG